MLSLDDREAGAGVCFFGTGGNTFGNVRGGVAGSPFAFGAGYEVAT